MAIYPKGRSYVFNKHKFVFLHTYKTGSHSITHALKATDKPIEKLAFPQELIRKGYYSAAVVRDPVDRFCSALSMYYGNRDNWIWKESITEEHRDILAPQTVEAAHAMVDKLMEVYPEIYDSHLHPQYDLVEPFSVDVVPMTNIEPWFTKRFGKAIGRNFASKKAVSDSVKEMVKSDRELLQRLTEFYAKDYKLVG